MKISPNGPFTDRSPSRGKEKKGRPTARVRGLGGQLGPTLPSRRLPSPPFGRHPRLPSRRGKVHPHRLYKGVPQERRTTQVTRAPPPLAAHLHILVCRPPLATALHPLPLLHGLPKGCAGGRSHHRCTPSCCRVSDPYPTPSTSAILVGTGILGVIVITVRVRVRGGAVRVVLELLLIFTTLRSAMSSSSSTLV
jgi:hypothetical protein